MTSLNITVSHLPPDRLEEAAHLAATALITSTSYSKIYQFLPEQKRLGIVKRLLYANIKMVYGKNPTCCYYGLDKTNNEMVCFFMLVPSFLSSQIGIFDHIRAGALYFPFVLGRSTVNALLATDKSSKIAKDKILGNKDHLELQRMAVSPHRQGQGIGSYCLSEIVGMATGLPIMLKTQTEANKRFYSKCGFKTVLEEEFSPTKLEKDKYINYYMLRD